MKISLDNFLQSENFCRILSLLISIHEKYSQETKTSENSNIYPSLMVHDCVESESCCLINATSLKKNSSNFTFLYKFHTLESAIASTNTSGIAYYHLFREFKASSKVSCFNVYRKSRQKLAFPLISKYVYDTIYDGALNINKKGGGMEKNNNNDKYEILGGIMGGREE